MRSCWNTVFLIVLIFGCDQKPHSSNNKESHPSARPPANTILVAPGKRGIEKLQLLLPTMEGSHEVHGFRRDTFRDWIEYELCFDEGNAKTIALSIEKELHRAGWICEFTSAQENYLGIYYDRNRFELMALQPPFFLSLAVVSHDKGVPVAQVMSMAELRRTCNLSGQVQVDFRISEFFFPTQSTIPRESEH